MIRSNGAHRQKAMHSTAHLLTAFANGVLMLAYHVHADVISETGEAPFIERVQEGPFGFSNLDWILLVAFTLVGFEVLQFAVSNGGSKWCLWQITTITMIA